MQNPQQVCSDLLTDEVILRVNVLRVETPTALLLTQGPNTSTLQEMLTGVEIAQLYSKGARVNHRDAQDLAR